MSIGEQSNEESERAYQPPLAVRQFIERLEGLSPPQIEQSLTELSSIRSIPPEAWVFFARRFQRLGDQDRAWRIATVAGKWVERYVAKRLRRWLRMSSSEKEEYVDEMLMCFYERCMSDRPADVFWQIRTGVCLDRQLATRLDRFMRKTEWEHVPLESDTELGDALIDTIPDLNELDPQTALIARDAIGSLKEPWKTAFHLIHHVELTEAQAAALMNVTPRSIRNYLRGARERLRAYLLEDV